jgi:hypothetical protein
MTQDSLEDPEDVPDPAKPVPAISFVPPRMMHDYLVALSGGTMGKNPTAVATFLLTREIQRLIEAKHIRGDWF